MQMNVELVRTVQHRLKELGYHEVGDIDGELGKKTEAAILDFRNRNYLPLTPTIDDSLIRELELARPKQNPIQQETATVGEVSDKVDVVNSNWWSKIWAGVLAVPNLLIAAILGVSEQFDDAINLIAPVKQFFYDQPIPGYVWMGGVGLIALAIYIMTQKAETELVAGYREGTVKNDKVV